MRSHRRPKPILPAKSAQADQEVYGRLRVWVTRLQKWVGMVCAGQKAPCRVYHLWVDPQYGDGSLDGSRSVVQEPAPKAAVETPAPPDGKTGRPGECDAEARHAALWAIATLKHPAQGDFQKSDVLHRIEEGLDHRDTEQILRLCDELSKILLLLEEKD